MPNNKLILRTLTSPWGAPFTDFTKNSVLTFQDLDNNQIYLKGELIYTATTSDKVVTFSKIGGETINLDLTPLFSGTTENYYTTGSTLNDKRIVFGRTDVTPAYDVDLEPLVSGFTTNDDLYFTSGSTGTGSIVSKPNLSTGGDATGDYSFSIGSNTAASGVGSRSGGFGTSASGNYSIHEGVGYIVNTGSNITISDLQYFEFERVDINTMLTNYVEGGPLTPPVTVNGDTHIIIAGDVSFTGTSKFQLLEGFFMEDSQNDMAVNMRYKNPYDFTEIEITSSFDGTNTTLVFSPKLEDVYYNIQYANYALDTGYGAMGNASTVLGSLNVSDSDNSFTFGNNSLNQSNNGFVGGEYARNSTGFEGDNYNVDYSFVFGRSVQNNSRASVIIGEASSIRKNGNNNTLLGYDNNIGNSSGDNYMNVIIGESSSIFGSSTRNVLIGHQNIVYETYDYNYILGSQNKIINGSKNVVLGVDNDVDGGSTNSFVLSQNSVITADNSIILGGYSINATSSNTAYVPNLNIDTTPQNDNVLTQVLVRDNISGDVKYKDISSFTDLNVTGGTYNINTGIVTFTNNEGNTFDVGGFTSGMTDSFTTGATLNGNIIEFGSNLYGADFYNIDLTSIVSGNTFLNGLTTITGTTRLGGNLIENTTLTLDGTSEARQYIINDHSDRVYQQFYTSPSNNTGAYTLRVGPDGGGGARKIENQYVVIDTNMQFFETIQGGSESVSYSRSMYTSNLGISVFNSAGNFGSNDDELSIELGLTQLPNNTGSRKLYFNNITTGNTDTVYNQIYFEDSESDDNLKGVYLESDYSTGWDEDTPDNILGTKGYIDRALSGTTQDVLWTAGTGTNSIAGIVDGTVNDNIVSGDWSIAAGYGNEVSDRFSTSFGRNNSVSGQSSVAIGQNNNLTQGYSVGLGRNNNVNPIYGVAIGYQNQIDGFGASLGWFNTILSGNTGVIMLGNNLTSKTDDATHVDKLNINNVPTGASVNNLGVDVDGNVVIGSTSTSGNTTTANYRYTINSGFNSSNIFNDGNIRLDFSAGAGTSGTMEITVLTLPPGTNSEVEYISTLFDSNGVYFDSGLIAQINTATDMHGSNGLSTNQRLEFILSSGTYLASYPTYKITAQRTGSSGAPLVIIIDVINN
jgi:hypothetical protein